MRCLFPALVAAVAVLVLFAATAEAQNLRRRSMGNMPLPSRQDGPEDEPQVSPGPTHTPYFQHHKRYRYGVGPYYQAPPAVPYYVPYYQPYVPYEPYYAPYGPYGAPRPYYPRYPRRW